MRIGRVSLVAAGLAVALFMGTACSSSSKKETDTPPTTVSSDPVQAADDEAHALLAALHEEKDEFCKTPAFETNISIPAEQKLPIPVTRGRCIYDGARIYVIAFEKPADRLTYLQRWTALQCEQSNQGALHTLGGTNWIINPRTITLVPTPDQTTEVQKVIGGDIHQELCGATTPTTT